jgi:phosphoenolpyruvate carboxykinase (GTP)
MPTPDGLDLPNGFPAEDMRNCIKVDVAGWKAELADIGSEHYPRFGVRLPKELLDQLERIGKRLE